MGDLYDQERMELQRLTGECVKDLTRIWSNMFEQSTCAENFTQLKDHVEKLYTQLKEESMEKQNQIRNNICRLHGELEKLCRVLKVNIDLCAVNDCNVPLVVLQAKIEKSLSDLREELHRRQEEVKELLSEQIDLCRELGEPLRRLQTDPLPTADEITSFRQHLEKLKIYKVERLTEITLLRQDIKKSLEILKLEDYSVIENRLLNDRDITLHKNTIATLRHMKKMYENRVKELTESIETMHKKLEDLWERLNTSLDTRKRFKDCVDCTHQTYSTLSAELKRCEAIQSENIMQRLQQIRKEIVIWWDKTLKSEQDRKNFTNFNNSCYTDDLLTLHEMELEDLKQFYDENQEIFELYAIRKQLWERLTELEIKVCDPARFNNRGGQLLKEEKERKTIAAKLPKIEQQIKKLVLAYQDHTNEQFLIYGKNILDVMLQDLEKKRIAESKTGSVRKNVHTSYSSGKRASMGTNNLVGKKPSTINLPKVPSSITSIRNVSAVEKNMSFTQRRLVYPPNSPNIKPKPAIASTSAPNSHRAVEK